MTPRYERETVYALLCDFGCQALFKHRKDAEFAATQRSKKDDWYYWVEAWFVEH